VNARQARYILSETMIMLGRRKAAGAIAVVIMGLSLLILVVFLMVTLNAADTIEKMREETRVFVYLEDGLEADARERIQLRLLGLRGVDEVVFISKEEALGDFRETLGEQSDLLGELEGNPLPDAFRVRPRQAFIRSDYMRSIAEEAGSWPGVEDVRYGRKWFERGERLVRSFFIIDLALGLIIFLSVMFVIYNTVRLTVLHRRRSIDVMKLVGATNAYIQIPFILEGALHGTAASLLAIALLSAIYAFASRYLPGLVFLRTPALAGFVVFCAVLGAAGSYSAMRRFIRA